MHIPKFRHLQSCFEFARLNHLSSLIVKVRGKDMAHSANLLSSPLSLEKGGHAFQVDWWMKPLTQSESY